MKMETDADWLLHVHTNHVSCLARAPVVETVLVRMIVKDVITVHNYSIALSLKITYVLSVNQTLLECPITTEVFVCFFSGGRGYDFNACNNVRDILYNTDAITSVVKLIVHRPMEIYIKRKEIRRNPIPSIYIAYSYIFFKYFF